MHEVSLNTITASGKQLNQTFVNDVLVDCTPVINFPVIRPNELHIIYNYDYQDHPRGCRFDHTNALKQIRRRYRSSSCIRVFANDVVCALRGDHWQNLPEFEFFRQLQDQMPKTPCKFYHSQNFPHCEWADHYLYFYLNKFEKFNAGPQLDPVSIPRSDFSSAVKALSCLNATGRPHRIIFAILLVNTDCVLSYLDVLDPDYVWSKIGFGLSDLTPHIRRQYKKNLPVARRKFDIATKFVSNPQLRDHVRSSQGITESIQLIQQGFCHVITDDPFASSWPRITEKTLKPMIAQRPFLMLGAQGNLAWLRSKGFRTFDQWWDESYDQQSDEKRLQSVYKIARHIDSLSIRQRQYLLEQMRPVLDHNFEHLKAFHTLTYNNIKGSKQ